MTAVRYVEFSKSIVYVMWPLSPYVVLLDCFSVQNFTDNQLISYGQKTIFKMAAVRICVPNSIQIGWFFVENEICRFHDFQDGGSTQSWKSTDAGEFTVTAAGQFTSTPAGPTVKFTPDHSRAENFTSQSVLTATFNSDGDRQISTPPQEINAPWPIDKNSTQLISLARGPPIPNLVEINALRVSGQMGEI